MQRIACRERRFSSACMPAMNTALEATTRCAKRSLRSPVETRIGDPAAVCLRGGLRFANQFVGLDVRMHSIGGCGVNGMGDLA
jgi:hypothetical protein